MILITSARPAKWMIAGDTRGFDTRNRYLGHALNFGMRLPFPALDTYFWCHIFRIYRKPSNIRRTLVDNMIVDHSYVDGASPSGAARTTSSFST